jgi:hypothetical protein
VCRKPTDLSYVDPSPEPITALCFAGRIVEHETIRVAVLGHLDDDSPTSSVLKHAPLLDMIREQWLRKLFSSRENFIVADPGSLFRVRIWNFFLSRIRILDPL